MKGFGLEFIEMITHLLCHYIEIEACADGQTDRQADRRRHGRTAIMQHTGGRTTTGREKSDE